MRFRRVQDVKITRWPDHPMFSPNSANTLVRSVPVTRQGRITGSTRRRGFGIQLLLGVL